MTDEDKARHLRALYRDNQPRTRVANGKLLLSARDQDKQWQVVRAEFAKLYPDGSADQLAQIISTAWIEERELKGQYYDYAAQDWRNADGSVVRDG